MRHSKIFTISAAAGLAIMGMGVAAHAVQLSDGTVHFENPPRLVDSSIRQQTVADSNVKYFFHLTVPSDAGEPLQQVEIVQQNGTSFTREVEFEPEESVAFVGHGVRGDRSTAFGIGTATYDDETQTLALTFDPPIPPGTDVTIRLNAERNPRRSGVYLFGVTAYPQGAVSRGQFLGFGRFHIYDNGSDIFSGRSRWHRH